MRLDASKVLPGLADIVDRPAWLVRRGHASCLTFEFGQPHLQIDEPRPSDAASEVVRARAARRSIVVRGEWHLWINCCDWRVSDRGVAVAHSESADSDIDKAAAKLDGQKLISIAIEPAKGESCFGFDLGGLLETTPCESSGYDNWMLFAPDGYVLTYGGDGRYSWQHGDTPMDGTVWRSLLST